MTQTMLMTGATGFVGINLVRRYLEEGRTKLVLLVRPNEKSAEQRVHDLFGRSPAIEVVEGDIGYEHLAAHPTGRKQLEQRIDTIVHSAASTDMDDDNKEKTYRTNINGTLNVLYFALRRPDLGLFAYVSTAYVAGCRQGVVKEDELVNAGHKNPYESSKFLSEMLVRNMICQDKRMIFRPGVIVGHSQTGETQSFNMVYGPWKGVVMVKGRYIEKAKLPTTKGTIHVPFRIFGRDDARLNLIPVDTMVDMMYRIMADSGNKGKAFHLTNPEDVSLGFLRDQICGFLGMTGIEFVRPMPEDISTLEKFFYRNSKVLKEYMNADNPVFDRTNVMAALPGYTVPKPDERLMQTLIRYGDAVRWGR